MEKQVFTSTFGTIALYTSAGMGRPVLLVHGNSLSAESFQALFASSAADRYRLIAFDLPGHGASPRAADARNTYRIGSYVRLLREVAESLCDEPPILVGHSMGGHIAAQAVGAGLHIAGLMTIGSPPLSNLASMSRAFKNMPASGSLFKAEMPADELSVFATALWGVDAPLPDYLSCAISATDPRARDSFGRSLTEDSLVSEVATISALPFTAAILVGEHDGFVNAEYVREQTIPNAWKSLPFIVKGSGHCPMLDAPEVFARLLCQYIEGV